MYCVLVNQDCDYALVLLLDEMTRKLFHWEYPRYKIIAFGDWEQCQDCADAYNED